MKVLLVSPYFLDSYSNNLSMGSAVKLSTQLSKYHQVLVLTSGRKKSNEKRNPNLTVISVPGWLIPDPVNYMISPSMLLRFILTVRSFQPNIVIVSKYMFFSSLVIPIARIMGIPVITVTDTFPGINWFPPSLSASIVMWLYARVVGLPLLWISTKVILLYSGLEPVARRFHLNYEVIPNGVEPEAFSILPLPPDLHKPKRDFWVGYVGRPDLVKGYNLLLEIADSLPKIKFIFVGGNFSPHREKNRIYLGYRPSLPLFQLFDAFILPSLSEGLPNVVMEAMSQGVPVIANPVGGVKFLITHNKTGFLVRHNSVSNYVEYLSLLFSSPELAHKIGLAAKTKIKNDYNWKKILPRYNQLIIDLCKK